MNSRGYFIAIELPVVSLCSTPGYKSGALMGIKASKQKHEDKKADPVWLMIVGKTYFLPIEQKSEENNLLLFSR